MPGDTRDRAMRAQERARKLLWSTLTPLVRGISRNSKMRVVLSGKLSATDGKNTTYIKVPIELGDDTPHNKGVCGERDPETRVMVCPACGIFDDVMFKIYHETSHIVQGTFESIDDADLQRVVAEGIRISAEGKADSSRAAKIKAKFERECKFIDSYFVASNFISPFMKPLFNAVEDVYVDAKTLAYRPGLVDMYYAHVWKAFSEPIIDGDGNEWTWKDQPLNAQAAISVILAGKFPVEIWQDWLAPEVVEVHNDPAITKLIDQILPSNTSKKRYLLTMRLLEAFREHGFFVLPDDPEDEPPNDSSEGEQSGQDEQEQESHSGGSSDPESKPEPESSDKDEEGEGQDDDEDDGENDSEGGGGTDNEEQEDNESEGSGDGDDEPEDSDGDAEEEEKDYGDAETVERILSEVSGHADDDQKPAPSEAEAEQEMEMAIQQGEHFERPSRNVPGLKLIKPGGGGAFRRGSGSVEIPSTEIIGSALLKGRLTFTENKKGRTERNLERGKRLDGRVLAKRFPHGDPRLFKTKSLPGKRSYFVVVGLDVSGSTGGHICQLIKNCGAAQAELLHRLGVEHAVYAHTGEFDGEVLIHEVKAPGAPWGDAAKRALGSIGSYAANLDGHTLEYYRKVCDSRAETTKIILYFTDGAMPAENYAEELEILQREIAICRQKGYVLLGVGVRNDDPEQHGLETVRLDEAEDIGQVLDRLRSKLQ